MNTHNHSQTFQPDIEDKPFTEKMVLAQAVEELLISKGIITAEKIRKQIDLIDSRNPAVGAKLIAKSWLDNSFKLRLLSDVNRAAWELDIDLGKIPVRAIENTSKIHNVVVCTLCSCYPRMLIGLPPDWYKSRIYRSRVVKEPRTVLKEFGTHVPEDVEVRVYDSTADLRYLILPLQPAGTSTWNCKDLANLITRDSMIGVSRILDLPKN